MVTDVGEVPCLGPLRGCSRKQTTVIMDILETALNTSGTVQPHHTGSLSLGGVDIVAMKKRSAHSPSSLQIPEPEAEEGCGCRGVQSALTLPRLPTKGFWHAPAY
jgi:hypothetical protein